MADGSFLHGQAGLGAIESLDLAFFIDVEQNGVCRRIDVELDDVAQLGEELGIFGQLELPEFYAIEVHARQTRCTNAGRWPSRPILGFTWRRSMRGATINSPIEGSNLEMCGGPHLVAQQTFEALGEVLDLPVARMIAFARVPRRCATERRVPGPKPIQVHRHWSVLARRGPEGTGIRFAGMT
jgi:hypothetical protein